MRMIKNRRGWIRIVEVFIAILLITGSLALLIKNNKVNNEEIELQIHDKMVPVLREIQTNNTMRDAILDASLPVEWENFESQGLTLVRNKIINKIPSGFDCKGKLCALDETCTITLLEEENIYAETAFISADLDTYAPRQLKLFCWKK
jgi:hypothetical protein